MPSLELLTGERAENEPRQAVIACNDYLRMGSGRSLRGLHAQYCNDLQRSATPTRALRTLGEWSTKFSWQARAESYDADMEAEKTRVFDAARKAALEEGAALDYIRVGKLKRLSEFLEVQLFETEPVSRKVQDLLRAAEVEAEVAAAEIRDGARPPWMTYEPTSDEDLGEADDSPRGERFKNVWLRDYKGVAGIAYEIERFNAPLVDQYRGTLDDLAKETGGRKQKHEIGGPDGKPILIQNIEVVPPK